VSGSLRSQFYDWTKFETHGVGSAGVSVSTAGGRIRRIRLTNFDTIQYTVMVFDKGSAAVNGDTPIWRCNIMAKNTTNPEQGPEIDFGPDGITVANGISVAFSSTNNTLTLALVNSMSVQVMYK
jgi:hypothetical protein